MTDFASSDRATPEKTIVAGTMSVSPTPPPWERGTRNADGATFTVSTA
jgi:hypothetical protein